MMKIYRNRFIRYMVMCLNICGLALFISCSGGGGDDDDDTAKADLNGIWKIVSETVWDDSDCITRAPSYERFYTISNNSQLEDFIVYSGHCFIKELGITIEGDSFIVYDDEEEVHNGYSYEISGDTLTKYPEETENASCIEKEVCERSDSSTYEAAKAKCESK